MTDEPVWETLQRRVDLRFSVSGRGLVSWGSPPWLVFCRSPSHLLQAFDMKCYRCSNPATLHVTEIIKNVPHELHLCEECAQQYLANPKSSFPQASEDDEEADVNEEVQAELEEIDKLVCPNCGISFKEFRGQGRLGCPHDYIAFQEELLPLLENIHGETQHVGRIPKRAPEDSRKQFQIIKLKNDLRQAVAEESYEKAAEIRDEIQKLERELKSP